jgi:hypothetical protein
LEIDCETYEVKRESKYSNSATIYFQQPIKVIVEKVNDNPIIVDVNEIEGEFDYEWSWYRGERRQKDIANRCEIYFNCLKYYNR